MRSHLLASLVLILAFGGSGMAQRTKRPQQPPKALAPDIGRLDCQWYLLGFYLDMPEADALKHITSLQVNGEGYEHSYTAQVSFSVSTPKYSFVDSVTLRFQHGRVLDIQVLFSSPFDGFHVDDLAGWATKRYNLPNEWERSGEDKDIADNGIVRGHRRLDFRGVHFFVSNTDRRAYVSMAYQ